MARFVFFKEIIEREVVTTRFFKKNAEEYMAATVFKQVNEGLIEIFKKTSKSPLGKKALICTKSVA